MQNGGQVWQGRHTLRLSGEIKRPKAGSYQRARVAFDQAAVEWSDARWIWAERREDGTWQVTEKEADHGMPSV